VRVIAGKYRSRTLKTLRGLALRPTSDRLRETLFNILGRTIEGAVFVDAYAGSGAVGIEALSRGARHVMFLENHAAAVRLLRKNLSVLGISAGAEILSGDVARSFELLVARRAHPDFVFLDPPYAKTEEYERTLDFLGSSTLLSTQGWVLVEHSKRQALLDRYDELERTRVVEHGDAALSFYRLSLAA
jgi:16S rRNA (guanine(966)-N(2))-methyltransferase RsmD